MKRHTADGLGKGPSAVCIFEIEENGLKSPFLVKD